MTRVRERRSPPGRSSPNKQLLSIGEVARLTGIDPRTIRFYEAAGVLPAPPRLPNGYRAFRAEDVSRLRFIAGARRLGFTLPEVAEILAARERGEPPCARVLQAVESRLREVAARMAELRRLKSQLQGLIEAAQRLPARTAADGPCVCQLVEQVRRPAVPAPGMDSRPGTAGSARLSLRVRPNAPWNQSGWRQPL